MTQDYTTDSTRVAIIVPYRDLHPEQKRSIHLHRFIPHMQAMLTNLINSGVMENYHIYIVEQSDDGRKFNRGKLLNIGFDVASNNKYRSHESLVKLSSFNSFVFHDVDLLPCDNLGSYYARLPKKPLHIARVWDRYNNNPKYFGGIVSFSLSDMKRINGYPNTFWGWGGEDDEIQKRCERLGIHWDSPKEGSIEDLEAMSLKEKLDFLRLNKKWKCMCKWEALNEHNDTWRKNGLADLIYSVLEVKDFNEDMIKNVYQSSLAKTGYEIKHKSHVTKLTVDVMLNGNHWSNRMCDMTYFPS